MTDFIRAWREGAGQAALTKAFVPRAFGKRPVLPR